MNSRSDMAPPIAFARPAAPLRPFVSCYWHLEAIGPTAPQLFLPGLSLAWIFSLGAPGDVLTQGRFETQPQVFVKGLIGCASAMSNPLGARNFGVAFRTGAAAPFHPVPLDVLSDGFTDLAALGDAGLAALATRIQGAASLAEAAPLFDAVLLTILADAEDPWLGTLLLQRLKPGSPGTIAATARASGLSERQFRRLFRAHVGAGPARTRRIARLRRAAALMENGVQLTSVAHQAGYADQAHFTNEFRDMVGWTPGTYRTAPTDLMAMFADHDRPLP